MLLPKLNKRYEAIADSFYYSIHTDSFFLFNRGIYEGRRSGNTWYDARGMPVRFIAKGRGFEYDETYTYDEFGKIREIVWYRDSIRYREVFTYDDGGKPLTQIRYSPDGKQRRVLTYKYELD
jgi:YD repeat-containing protein